MHGWCTRNAHPSPDVQNLASNPPWQKPGCVLPPMREKWQKPPLKPEFWPSGEDNPSPDVRKNRTPWKILARAARKNFFLWLDFQDSGVHSFEGIFLAKLLGSPIITSNITTWFQAVLTPFDFFLESGGDRWCTPLPWKVTQVQTSTTWKSSRKRKSYPLCRPGPCTCMIIT